MSTVDELPLEEYAPVFLTRCPVHNVLTSRTGDGQFTLKCYKCVTEANQARVMLEKHGD